MKICCFCLLLLVSVAGAGQSTLADSVRTQRNRYTQRSLYVLGGWAALNIGTGLALAPRQQGSTRYFYRMNVYWNTVNLALAGLGTLALRKKWNQAEKFSTAYEQQQRLEKLYLFNTGLDIAYLLGGLVLKEKANNQAHPVQQQRYRGYGNSILLQGGFLLLLDGVLYHLHHRNTGRLQQRLNNWDIGGTGSSLSLRYHF